MKLTVEGPLQRRPCVAELTTMYGRAALVITAPRKGRKAPLVSTYLIERPSPGHVRLVTEGGKKYDVTAYSCNCPDSEFNGDTCACKHRCSLDVLNVLKAEGLEPQPEETHGKDVHAGG